MQFIHIFIVFGVYFAGLVSSNIPDDSPFRWNLVPKQLLKRLCNLDDSLPVCAWKRHLPKKGKKPAFSKWKICRDHPELNICRWENGGMVTVATPLTVVATTSRTEDSAEAPPTSDDIFVNVPDMMLSSKWSNAEMLQKTVEKELKSPISDRFDGQLRQETDQESSESEKPTKSDSDGVENFDESIMSANDGIFNV